MSRSENRPLLLTSPDFPWIKKAVGEGGGGGGGGLFLHVEEIQVR